MTYSMSADHTGELVDQTPSSMNELGHAAWVAALANSCPNNIIVIRTFASPSSLLYDITSVWGEKLADHLMIVLDGRLIPINKEAVVGARVQCALNGRNERVVLVSYCLKCHLTECLDFSDFLLAGRDLGTQDKL